MRGDGAAGGVLSGIIAVLNARVRFGVRQPGRVAVQPRDDVIDNIELPPTLLSRFDLIYLVLDKPNPEPDWRLARPAWSALQGARRR